DFERVTELGPGAVGEFMTTGAGELWAGGVADLRVTVAGGVWDLTGGVAGSVADLTGTADAELAATGVVGFTAMPGDGCFMKYIVLGGRDSTERQTERVAASGAAGSLRKTSGVCPS